MIYRCAIALGRGFLFFLCVFIGCCCVSIFGETGSRWKIVSSGPAAVPAPGAGQPGVSNVAQPRVGEAGVEAERQARLRGELTVTNSDTDSVLSRVVVTPPSPSPSPSATAAAAHARPPHSNAAASPSPTVAPTPPLKIVQKVAEPDVAVTKANVLSAVAGAPRSNLGTEGDFLDGVLEAQNTTSGTPVATPTASPGEETGVSATGARSSPSASAGVMITGESPAASASPTPSGAEELPQVSPTPSASPSGTPASANPAVPSELLPPIEAAPSPTPEVGPGPGTSSPTPSPSPEAPAVVQDKVYDLVSGRLPDRNSVRGPAEPRVGFFPRAPEPRTAENLFLEAVGGDLPTEQAGLW